MIHTSKFIDIKGWKSQGNRLSNFEIAKVKLLTPAISSDEKKTKENPLKEKSQTKTDSASDSEKSVEENTLKIGSKIE